MTNDSSPPLLEVRGISKQFSGVRALDNVSLTLARGEVLAVVGENGAGKSTLMRIVAGVTQPTSGSIIVDGTPVAFTSVAQALKQGISLIHQELNLADNLSVAANIFLGREPLRFGMIDQKRIDRESQSYIDMVGLDVPPQTIVGTLSIGKQQLVEIAKALSTNARILIMDEPTSSLSERESQKLFDVVRDLRSRGVSVLYISHRLHEVEQLADRIVVLRDGRFSGELSRADAQRTNIVRLMVGRDVSRFYQRTPQMPGAIVASVSNLRTTTFPHRAVSFELRAGEIVGLAGLVGAGRSELLATLFGITSAVSGSIAVGALCRPPRTVREAIAAGIVLAPEDRRRAGLFLPMSVKRNISLASLRRDQRRGFLNRTAENRVSAEMVALMRIKTASDRQVVRYLSGGNQQKVVLGKWLCLQPKLLLLDEPTRGIDVGSKEEIYKLMDQLAGRGVAILFASSDLEEVIGLSDRVLVMHEGRIAGELDRAVISEEAVMQLATGGADQREKDWRMTTETKPIVVVEPAGAGRVFSPQGAKIWGIFGLLLAICLYTALSSDRFLRVGNVENLVHRTALFGILSVGAAFVIITGGIDLSIGSLVCLVGVLLPYLLVQHGWSAAMAVVAVLGVSVAIGIIHGLLITKMRLQPFVVTLCGLLLYRGIARGLTGDQSQGFGLGFKGLRSIATSRLPIFGSQAGVFHLPATTLILIIIAVVAAIFLNKTIYGRYLLAIGNNPEAAKYSGINVDRTTLMAYVICSTLAGVGGMLFVLDINAAQPSDFGNFYELYAIAAAVLGGCSLRGGEGSITGVVIGAAVMVVLSNAINLVHPKYQNVEFAIIGGVILIGVVVDELARRFVAARREAARHANN